MTNSATELANRVKKNAKALRGRLKAQGTTCFRVYDRDIPELPLAIDVYGDWLHVIEYQGKHGRSDRDHLDFLNGLAHAAGAALDIPAERVVLKQRRRRLQGEEAPRQAREEQRIVVEESGLSFYVNLTDFIDTGLFLDHRPTRREIRKIIEGKRFLNLFAYTGAFTVYAAAGGAERTTTVDLSGRYLRWAEDNVALNRLEGSNHRFIKTDVNAFLHDARRDIEVYDVAIIDPPTASTSEKMEGDFDVQRDHTNLIGRTLELMREGGVVYFSTNFKRFVFDEAAFASHHVEEITARSVPKEFRQNPHRAWRIVR